MHGTRIIFYDQLALKRMTSVSKRGKKTKTVIRHFHWENPDNRNKSDDTKFKATNFSSFGSKNLQWLHIQQTEDCKNPSRKKGICKFTCFFTPPPPWKYLEKGHPAFWHLIMKQFYCQKKRKKKKMFHKN